MEQVLSDREREPVDSEDGVPLTATVSSTTPDGAQDTETAVAMALKAPAAGVVVSATIMHPLDNRADREGEATDSPSCL